MSQLLSFFQKMMEQNTAQTQEVLKTVVAEIRKPPVDPVKEVQKAREKETKTRGEKEYWDKIEAAKKNCAHTRQNGTSNIAWARQSDNVERGFCPYCRSTFTPDDGELYEQLRRMPRGMLESVRYVS
jgi:hypothetical protein